MLFSAITGFVSDILHGTVRLDMIREHGALPPGSSDAAGKTKHGQWIFILLYII